MSQSEQTYLELTGMMHTPGPWTTQAGDGVEIEINSDAPRDEWGAVATVTPNNLGQRIITPEEAAANARLIAAAPELLAALEAWTEWAVNRDIPFELISQTRLAIAKARGSR